MRPVDISRLRSEVPEEGLREFLTFVQERLKIED